jgi:hypothetical protein
MIAPVLWFLGGNFEAAQSLQMMIVLVCIASPSSLSLVYCCVSPKMIQLFGVRIACVASSYRSILLPTVAQPSPKSSSIPIQTTA